MSDDYEIREHTSSCGDARYHTRFGDVCCQYCDTPIGWDWRLVADEVLGSATPSWVRYEAERLRTSDPIMLAVGDWYVTRNNLQQDAHLKQVVS